MVEHHAQIGASILGQDRKLALAQDIALMHHEQWGGGGYPAGISGTDIPLPARILSVVDVFDALVNERPYKTAWTEAEALAFIDGERNRRFDPDVVEVFKRVVSRERESEIG
jgi:putative two-component system response regulator